MNRAKFLKITTEYLSMYIESVSSEQIEESFKERYEMVLISINCKCPEVDSKLRFEFSKLQIKKIAYISGDLDLRGKC